MYRNVNDDLEDVISLDFTVSLPTELKTGLPKANIRSTKIPHTCL